MLTSVTVWQEYIQPAAVRTASQCCKWSLRSHAIIRTYLPMRYQHAESINPVRSIYGRYATSYGGLPTLCTSRAKNGMLTCQIHVHCYVKGTRDTWSAPRVPVMA